MQRVSSLLPSWEKRTSSGSAIASTDAVDTVTSPQRVTSASSTSSTAGGGFWGWSKRSSTSTKTNSLSKINTAAANRNSSLSVRSTTRVHGETFWPTSLDLECEKAARIIKSFCADGYLGPIDDESSPVVSPTNDEPPKTPVKIYKKIPKQIIQNAAGIAVFSCMRNGLWMTGSGGSGILIARKSDGTWSPPSGIMLHTPTLSFIIGVDVYDCVLVVNSLAALESMTRPKVTLGEDVGLAYGASVSMEARDIEINVRDLGNTVMTYMKARGQEQKVNLHGSILTERANENERFYGSAVSQMEVLSGAVARYVEETQPLFEVIKMAEGRTDFDASMIGKIAAEPAPSDAIIVSPKFSAAPLSLQLPVPSAYSTQKILIRLAFLP
uniref:Ysc84 actin-binding domain-containing protein n=1 Tax=Bionectria ochroleuca TaxID=29856 RepID=A0A8H7TWB1_BIOOC